MMISTRRPARSRAVPLTVLRGIHSALNGRRSADSYDAKRMLRSIETRDGLQTIDAATIDSSGVFLIGELERLDQRLHLPLADVTWARDIELREDVTIADEVSSYTNSQFASAQAIPGSNKAWVGKNSNQIVNVQLDIGKTAQPLQLWAMQVDWTLPELLSSQRLGRPVDTQKFDGMQLKHQMDTDEQVYMGDTVLGMNGMLNHALLTNAGNAVNGSWATATPAQILADINSLLTSVWTASGYAVIPDTLLLAPPEFSILVSTLISSAGNISVLRFIQENNLAMANGRKLNVQPVKWLLGTNNGGQGPAATDSMYAYMKDQKRIRFPMVPLQRTPIEYRDLRQITTYFGRLGSVEMVYPETVGRRSSLG